MSVSEQREERRRQGTDREWNREDKGRRRGGWEGRATGEERKAIKDARKT